MLGMFFWDTVYTVCQRDTKKLHYVIVHIFIRILTLTFKIRLLAHSVDNLQ